MDSQISSTADFVFRAHDQLAQIPLSLLQLALEHSPSPSMVFKANGYQLRWANQAAQPLLQELQVTNLADLMSLKPFMG